MRYDHLKRAASRDGHPLAEYYRPVSAPRSARVGHQKFGVVEGPVARSAIEAKLLSSGRRTVHRSEDRPVGVRYSAVICPVGSRMFELDITDLPPSDALTGRSFHCELAGKAR